MKNVQYPIKETLIDNHYLIIIKTKNVQYPMKDTKTKSSKILEVNEYSFISRRAA